MEDELDAANGVVNTLVASQLPLNDFDVVLDPGQVRAVAGGEVVEDADGVAALQQRVHEVAADESGSAGDKDLATHAPTLAQPSRTLARIGSAP